MLPPLRLQPIFKQRPWGGRRLAELWGKSLGGLHGWGESWEVVDLGRDQSRVIGGECDGQLLGQLVHERGAELLGETAESGPFLLLFKFLDAAERLSVQVHPNDEQAARLAPGQHGKSEAWVIIAAEPSSELSVGLRTGIDRAALERHLAAGTVAECLHTFPARVGDVISVPAGTLHAIGAGVALAELQQPSDVTFRLFDWNRLDAHSRPRTLHIAEALECIDFARPPAEAVSPRVLDPAAFYSAFRGPAEVTRHEELIRSEHFVWRRHRSDGARFSLPSAGQCRVLSLIDGAAELSSPCGTEHLRPGDTLLIPASCASVTLQPIPRCVLLESWSATVRCPPSLAASCR